MDMKFFLMIPFVFAFILNSCEDDNDVSRSPLDEPKAPLVQQGKPDQSTTLEEDEARLSKMLAEIIALAESKECSNPKDWAVSAYGAKACGGPIGYIAYSKKINKEEFLEKVKAYTKAQDEFNRKWEVISDCMLALEPSGVKCVGGKPELVYGF
jgi:hypothetical protein